jgi:hypothetical protein
MNLRPSQILDLDDLKFARVVPVIAIQIIVDKPEEVRSHVEQGANPQSGLTRNRTIPTAHQGILRTEN